MAEWRNGGRIAEWSNGGNAGMVDGMADEMADEMAEWRNGGWNDGGMA
jgi:hypothetical protein